MKLNIDTLPIEDSLKREFSFHLEKFGVAKMYNNILGNLNPDDNIVHLTAYSKQDYLNKDMLLQLYKYFKLHGDGSYEQIYSQLSTYQKQPDLVTLQYLFPEQSVNILELLYLKPEKLARIISQQITELQTYNEDNKELMTTETIKTYLKLREKYLIFTSNFSKLYYDNKSLFNNDLNDSLNIEVAKRVVYLQKTLHQLRGTRICIIDTETTGFKNPKPIQISFLLLDINFNLIKTYDRYIKQDYIEPSATSSSHGITVSMLNNVLPSVEPEEAYSEIKTILNDDKVVFIAHNANYDIRVLNNLKSTCDDAVPQSLKSICTYQNYNEFSDTALTSHSLKPMVFSAGIKSEDIEEEAKKLFGLPKVTTKFHNATIDATALYLFIKQSKFFTNIN